MQWMLSYDCLPVFLYFTECQHLPFKILLPTLIVVVLEVFVI